MRRFGWFLGVVSVWACDGGTGDTAVELPDSLGQCEPSEMVGWSEVEPLFALHCTSCHSSELEGAERQGASTGIDYDSLDTARLNGELTWQLVRSGQMPLQGTVPFDDAMIIWEWLSCGGPG